MRTQEEMISRLIASIPYSPKAPFSLDLVARDIENLRRELGGLDKVAEIVKVSEGMLNQFLKVKKLSPKIQKLVSDRVVDGVTLVHNLAKFSYPDQEVIVNEIISGNLKGTDVRLLSPLRTQYTDADIKQLIEKLKNSENKKVSVIKFNSEDLHKEVEKLRKDLVRIVGKEELIDLLLSNGEGSIKLTSKGEKELRSAAKRQKKSFQEFTYSILQ